MEDDMEAQAGERMEALQSELARALDERAAWLAELRAARDAQPWSAVRAGVETTAGSLPGVLQRPGTAAEQTRQLAACNTLASLANPAGQRCANARTLRARHATKRLRAPGDRPASNHRTSWTRPHGRRPGAHHRDGHRLPKTRAERRRRCSLSVTHSSPNVYRRRGVVGVNARPYHDTHLILRGNQR